MMTPIRLLFVCSGNICRSPMAEGLARQCTDERGLEVEVRSCGTLGIEDSPADPYAIAVCRELGIDISNHRSQGVTDQLISWATHVLVMEIFHSEHIRAHHSDVAQDIYMLGHFAGFADVPDPIGGWKFQFRRSRNQIDRCVRGFLDRLS